MPLPMWIMKIGDPAYAYMVRSAGVSGPPSKLRRPGLSRRFWGYSQSGCATSPQASHATTDVLHDLQTQAADRGRRFKSRLQELEARHGELLRATAADLNS